MSNAPPILRLGSWLDPHGFTGREGGISATPFASLNLSFQVGDAAACVRQNWLLLKRATGELPMVIVRQVHGREVLVVSSSTDILANDAAQGGVLGEADAIVSMRKGLLVGVLTADCVPILLRAPRARCVAAVHAGWKGTAKDIVGAVVERMRQLGVAPEDIEAVLGPSIGPCCYEVGDDVAVELLSIRVGQGSVRRLGGKSKWHVDLRAINRELLRRAGVSPDAIADLGRCTACDSARSFSHRGSGGRTGRQLAFIGLTN